MAPKRDLGFNGYGEIQTGRRDWSQGGQFKINTELAAKRCAWAGGVKQFCLAPGDRVVIMDGQDKGKIDRIQSIEPQNGFVLLEKLNRAIDAPPFPNMPIMSNPYPLAADAVRLVYPLKNPDTGVTRDVIVNQLKPVAPNMSSRHMTLERWEHGNKWDRVALGVNVVIPWPEVEAPEYKTFKPDTARDLVEARTFYYNLTTAPIPSGVIDELRGPFSRFRTRHEAWYIEKKEAEAAAKRGAHRMHESMRTPLEEFHEKRKAERLAQGEPELSETMLEKIGQVMARNKQEALERAGMQEAGSTTQPPSSTA